MGELRTILYVEDDSDIQEVVTMALEVVGGYRGVRGILGP